MAIHSPYETLAELVIRRPVLVLVVLGAVILASLVGTTYITMATGSETYVDKDTERGVLLDKYTSNFQSDSIMLLVESDDVLHPDVLAYLDRLQSDVSHQKNVAGVASIADLARQMN
ncbi:MAG: RND family transporter, partial [Methanolinea sp.]|nr:RND family transporter [Methanolinea sp.]